MRKHQLSGTLKIAVLSILILVSAAAASQNKSDTPPRGIPPSTNPEICPAGAPAGIASPIEAMGYGDFKGIIHAHSYLSHDSQGSLSRIIQAAQTDGINFILMTDHPSPYSVNHGVRGMHGGILFMPGQEINLSTGGVVLGINLQDTVPSGSLQSVIDAVHKQGGLAILGHIEEHTDWTANGWDAMEIYNTHYDAILDGKIDKTIALVPYLDKDPDRVWRSILDKPTVYLKAWNEAQKKRCVPGVAANDSHENVVYNGIQLDTYERSYGLVSTHLFLMELSQSEIYRAITNGHGYVCFDVFGSCRGFSFIAGDGKNISIMGDEYTIDPKMPSTIEISTPVLAKIQLLKDGAVVKEKECQKMTYDLTEPGVYRVEAYLPQGKKHVQWIFSNAIYVH
jgi:predicted metal-dependent phosphoesterase TrpH